MRLEVTLLSIPFVFCLSLFALRASIATRISKGVSLSLRTVVYLFFIIYSSFRYFCIYYIRKDAILQMCKSTRRFKSPKNEKVRIFQQKISDKKTPPKTQKTLDLQGFFVVVVFSSYKYGVSNGIRTHGLQGHNLTL